MGYRPLPILAVLAVGVNLALQALGSDGRPARAAAPASAPAAAPAPVPGTPDTPLVVAPGGPPEDPAFLPVHAAAALGVFEAEGLTVVIRKSKHPTAAMDRLRSGEAAIAVTTLDQAIRGGWIRDTPVRVLVAHTRAPGFALVASRAVPQPVTRATDLRGRRVGGPAPGTTGHLLLLALLREARLKVVDVTLESLGGPTLTSRLLSGGVDVAILEEPWLGRALAAGTVTVLTDFRDPEETARRLGGPFYEVVSVARADEKEQARMEKPVGAYARALLRTQAWLAAATPEAVAERLPPGLAPDRQALMARLTATRGAYAPGGEATLPGLTASMEVLRGGSPWPVTLKMKPADLREPAAVTAARTALGPEPPAP